MAKNYYNKFKKNFPEIFNLATGSQSEDAFCQELAHYSKEIAINSTNESSQEAALLILEFFQAEDGIRDKAT